MSEQQKIIEKLKADKKEITAQLRALKNAEKAAVKIPAERKKYNPGKRFLMDVKIEQHANGQFVTWTCPKCGVRQTGRWFGREMHLCKSCEEWTDIKGMKA